MTSPQSLAGLIEEEIARDPPPAVAALAEAARQRHGKGIVAILFYGSVLRDHRDEGRIIDLYLLADHYASVHRSWIARTLNAVLPPNVYYLEIPFEDRRVRAKYSVMTLEHFERAVSKKAFHPYFWARFAQPVQIAWVGSKDAKRRTIAALALAVTTLADCASPLFKAPPDSRSFWVRAFRETYATELRAERSGRAEEIYNNAIARYDAIFRTLLHEESLQARSARSRAKAIVAWYGRRMLGKCLSVLRLIKAAFTFQDGADYLAWKITRHSGVVVELTPWQRRHPILAAPSLFWRLYFRGAFR